MKRLLMLIVSIVLLGTTTVFAQPYVIDSTKWEFERIWVYSDSGVSTTMGLPALPNEKVFFGWLITYDLPKWQESHKDCIPMDTGMINGWFYYQYKCPVTTRRVIGDPK